MCIHGATYARDAFTFFVPAQLNLRIQLEFLSAARRCSGQWSEREREREEKKLVESCRDMLFVLQHA